MYDVLIIGAGVVGATIARELSKYSLSICIVDKENDVAMGASKANSGIVHSGYDAKTGTLKAFLNIKGAALMKQLANELGVEYKQNGSLVVGFNDDDVKTISRLYERGRANGVSRLEVIDKNKIKTLEPNISDNAVCALYAPTGAIISPYKLTIAAVGNAMDNGVHLKLDFSVKDISFNGDYYEASSEKETIKALYIINAAGICADEISGGEFQIHPRRGEYLVLDKECGGMVRNTIFTVPSKMGKGILVTPTADGNLLLGPTAEDIPDKEDKRTTQKGIERIIESASACVSGIPFNNTIAAFCGLRAVSDTGDFIIRRTKPRFISVGGIDSPGLTAAPAIAVYVTDMLKSMGMELVPNKSFNPQRKKQTAEKSKYCKMVCRCEQVSEGEIIEAIHTNPKALNTDAVKRRTRSGMGRCQGGFCLPYIIDILSRELGIRAEDITKSGGNSKYLIGKTK